MEAVASVLPKTARSELTLAAILDTALAMAAADGLESLTIGEVAKRLGLSKSGVFSRVGSREALQRAVNAEYDKQQAAILKRMLARRLNGGSNGLVG